MTKRTAGIVGVALLQLVLACGAEPTEAPPDEPEETTAAEIPAVSPAERPVAKETAQPLLSWGFEPASADCNGWPYVGAVAIRAAPPRTGAYSCKVCTKGPGSGALTLARDVGGAPPGRYVLTAWVRKRAATPAPPEATARIEAYTASGVVTARATPITVREAWDRLEAVVSLADGASRITIEVGAPPADDACLFVDDVTLVRE